jgi:hypothetical protein
VVNAYSGRITDAHLEELLAVGFVKLPALGEGYDLDKLAGEVARQVAGNTFTELGDLHRDYVDRLDLRRGLANRLYSLARRSFGYKGGPDDQYHIARFVTPGNSKECFRSHFDSHLFTLVLPISIPSNEESLGAGELIFVPRARRHPRNELENLATKAYFKRYASERAIRSLLSSGACMVESFAEMRPLLFLGMTTLHTNMPVTQGASKPRLTFLAHYFDPASKVGVGSLLRRLRNR